jgi:hypothetical protein
LFLGFLLLSEYELFIDLITKGGFFFEKESSADKGLSPSPFLFEAGDINMQRQSTIE